MNILLLNADGPDSFGLKVLRDAIKQHWKECTLYTLVPGEGGANASMGASRQFRRELSLEDFTKIESNYYLARQLTPVDVVDLAFLRQELFLHPKASWDLVVVGVAAGHVLGTDTYRSATTGAAMYAATAYRVAAHCFAQHLGESEDQPTIPHAAYKVAQAILPDYFRSTIATPGECWSVNFPPHSPQGYATVPTAHYSARRMPPTSVIPRSRDEKTDVTQLEKGYITTALLNMRINQPLRY